MKAVQELTTLMQPPDPFLPDKATDRDDSLPFGKVATYGAAIFCTVAQARRLPTPDTGAP